MADPALDLAAALRLADKLDMAVMHMLESCATDEAAAEERGNSLEGPSKEVASAVTQLERLLENLQVPAPSKKEQLEQEITELEKELQSKETLLQHTRKKVNRWQSLVEDVKEKHVNMLFSNFPPEEP